MARTKKVATPPPLPVEQTKLLGELTTSGTVSASAVIDAFQANLMGKDLGFGPIHDSLRDRVKAIRAGDLGMVESMLFCQAAALQTIFSSLTRRAASQDYLQKYQTYMTLGLKAQAQSRATLEALIEMKRPRQQPTFVKQANIAAGHQQVNNSPAPGATLTSNTENTAPEPNELLEAPHGNWLDIGAARQTSGAHSHLGAMEGINRAAHP